MGNAKNGPADRGADAAARVVLTGRQVFTLSGTAATLAAALEFASQRGLDSKLDRPTLLELDQIKGSILNNRLRFRY